MCNELDVRCEDYRRKQEDIQQTIAVVHGCAGAIPCSVINHFTVVVFQGPGDHPGPLASNLYLHLSSLI